jgi:hypothetical protein
LLFSHETTPYLAVLLKVSGVGVVVRVMVQSNPSGLSRQHTIETALLLKTEKLITATNMDIINPNLRDTGSACTLSHAGA